ncbi:hypothetical protein FTUN_1758 [Frigoriglobus tundricola]|uniref:Uncharacterized protein n=1 Tax=Frigoriglobus tundricola TaxID=2774151 RepID=A0A6M5YJT2_9BACT|nr:hypothetical protein FTUN_1758 [Frigoriglobus tundricola]
MVQASRRLRQRQQAGRLHHKKSNGSITFPLPLTHARPDGTVEATAVGTRFALGSRVAFRGL